MTIKPWLQPIPQMWNLNTDRDYPPKRKKPWTAPNFIQMEHFNYNNISIPSIGFDIMSGGGGGGGRPSPGDGGCIEGTVEMINCSGQPCLNRECVGGTWITHNCCKQPSKCKNAAPFGAYLLDTECGKPADIGISGTTTGGLTYHILGTGQSGPGNQLDPADCDREENLGDSIIICDDCYCVYISNVGEIDPCESEDCGGEPCCTTCCGDTECCEAGQVCCGSTCCDPDAPCCNDYCCNVGDECCTGEDEPDCSDCCDTGSWEFVDTVSSSCPSDDCDYNGYGNRSTGTSIVGEMKYEWQDYCNNDCRSCSSKTDCTVTCGQQVSPPGYYNSCAPSWEYTYVAFYNKYEWQCPA